MAEYREKLNQALKDAMRAKDNDRRDALRLIISEIKQVEVDTRKELSAEEELAILQKEAKKRRESLQEFIDAGRDEMAEKARYELDVIKEFLPEQMSREEVEVLAKQAIEKTGASSPKDMGQVMSELMPHVSGRADGKMVSEVVRELLS